MDNNDFLDALWKNIGIGGPSSIYSFETFILNLLRHHAKLQDKRLRVPEKEHSVVDAVAPSGIFDLSGYTAIVIKFNINGSSVKSIIDKYANSVALVSGQRVERKLLIITAIPVRKSTHERILHGFSVNNAWVTPIIWGPDEINRIIEIDKDFSIDSMRNIFSIRVKDNAESKNHDWIKERKIIIDTLKGVYNKGQFSLFLGAGVSSSAGMPDWNTLLNSLFVSYLSKETTSGKSWSESEINDFVNRLNVIDERSALMSARYIRKGFLKNLSDDRNFRSEITRILYKLRKDQGDSDLISAIATICMPKRSGAKVQSVYTYNFDDLLERKLKELNIASRSIFSGTGNHDSDELPIYHVHGFLPEDSEGHAFLEQSTLVFSEEGYHQVYSDAYHWSNLAQLSGLQNNHCLMIGLSMSDPNLRRLLDISAKNTERTSHYSFMRRLSHHKFCHDIDEDGIEKDVIKNKIDAEVFLQRHHALNEELMKELGVNIIWYEDYKEIPELIRNIMA